MIPEYKQYLNALDAITYLFSKSVKTITNYQTELSELMEISITSSHPIILEIFKISTETKPVWIRHLLNLNFYRQAVGMKDIFPSKLMTKNKYTGRYRLGLNSLFLPHTNPF